MKLKKLLSDIDIMQSSDSELLDKEVENVTCDSRHVKDGSVFVCVRGAKSDGHDHAKRAIELGAVAVIVSHDIECGDSQILVSEDTRTVYAKLCAAFYLHPAKHLKLIGVTGTNGKTTVTNIIKQILKTAGYKVGLIGTIQNEIDDMVIPAKYTTPDPTQLHALLARMKNAGCDYVVMETSSHALHQHRLEGLQFDVGVFTNLTQDHLDYHGTMEEYYLSKKKLFDISRCSVINTDDVYGRRLVEELSGDCMTFSVSDNNVDCMAKNIKLKSTGVRFELLYQSRIDTVSFCTPGLFSVSNAVCSASCCLALGIPFDDVVKGLCHAVGVKGRMQPIDTGRDFSIICDYAHTPDGLEKLLSTMREFSVGAAGERDRTKRAKMAEIVSKYSDFVIITSDNPRCEDPNQIIADVKKGMKKGVKHRAIEDRYEAIFWAVKHAQKDDIIILAGKGHEDYQVLAGCTIYFDEREVVKEALAQLED